VDGYAAADGVIGRHCGAACVASGMNTPNAEYAELWVFI
jgi:hypothetical protein